jgi:outer membrane protein assembly factor BamB
LLVSGLGFINTSNLYALTLDPKADKRVVWTRTSPFIRQPTVSSPGLGGGKLVFGDGMHQTNGATLYALQADGKPLWQLALPGDLVHLEGSPTLAGGRVYVGGGAAGVLCVDLDKVTLDGKEMDSTAIAKLLAERWTVLQKKYEEAKRNKDPFAVPPTEDDLPKPAPVKLWQQGKDRWHVDAPVAVAGDRVLVASAYLDKEKVGERGLFCLDARTGKEIWKAPLSINPWGGPSVQGDTIVVTGSTIGYDPKLLKGAKGVIAAFELSTGKPKWKKDVPGGVTSCAALTPDSVVFAATDGRVRAFNLATGALRWFYDAKAPLFAPPAVAGDMVYVGDLEGVVHAVQLKSGAARWTLALAKDPAVAAPGMIYAGPVVHGGQLFVASNNLAGAHVNGPTAVVCIGEK